MISLSFLPLGELSIRYNPNERQANMALSKQAKTLTEAQQKTVLEFIKTTRHKTRNEVMLLLSVDAGLRAKEIAALEWSMITDASGQLTDQIRLEDKAAKGKSGGVVWMSKRLGLALARLKAETAKPSTTVIISQNAKAMSAQVVINWFFSVYRELGFDGCSSHSGRRTAITRWARKISSVGGSLRDVQALARHSSLAMTQKYIEVSEDACRRGVG
jgi:integrase